MSHALTTDPLPQSKPVRTTTCSRSTIARVFSKFGASGPSIQRVGCDAETFSASASLARLPSAFATTFIRFAIYRWYIAALAYTGMRAGEGAVLQVGDVDLDSGVVHVRRNHRQGTQGRPLSNLRRAEKNGRFRFRRRCVPTFSLRCAESGELIQSSRARGAEASTSPMSVAPSTGRRSGRSSTARICASMICGTLSRPCSSTRAHLRTTFRRCWDTPACR